MKLDPDQHGFGVSAVDGRTQEVPWDLGFGALALLVVVILLAVGHAIDTVDEREALRREQQRMQDMAEAYTAGQRDAHEALAGKPEGVQLVQACLAAGFAQERRP
ncbi:MAG: hypothetical protein KIT60_06880 [Burkholderiaceae bacterium]|nr:hypothetical protein [Burkholderiaceae bacterium]